jgi:transposase
VARLADRTASRSAYGVTIVGPVAEDPGWQACAGEGFDKGSFAVDWDREVVTCPAGNESVSWLPNTYPKNGMDIEARFARKVSTPCPCRPQWTRSKHEPRIIGLLPREQHEALRAARREQGSEELQSRYAARAGIEGTHT